MTNCGQKHGREEVKESSSDVAVKKKIQKSQLDGIKEFTKIVADTGDFHFIKKFSSHDVTTNPSLILAAAQLPIYAHLVDDAIVYGRRSLEEKKKKEKKKTKEKEEEEEEELEDIICNRLLINFGKECLNVVQGVVSTEVDAKYSFDVEKSVKMGLKLISMYEEVGVSKNQILIKLAGTWEGCQAAKILEAQGIHCNITLIFHLVQAIAAANSNAFIISPFVGRVLDWHKKNSEKKIYTSEEDPGVELVRKIFKYFQEAEFKTEVMGASFRNKEEVIALAGCDRLTIPPKILEELQNTPEEGKIVKCLKKEKNNKSRDFKKIEINENIFRWMLNEDAMATEKLAEGIRLFHRDSEKLRAFISSRLEEEEEKGRSKIKK